MPAVRSSNLPIGWPLLAIIGGYPVAWLLGVKLFLWPLVGVLLMLWLLQNRGSLRAPAGIGLWFLFLSWTLLSAFTLTGIDQVASWGYREGFYLTATVILIFLVNVSPRELPTRRLAIAVLSLFAATVALGMVGILYPDFALPTPAEKVLPQALTNIQFLSDQFRAQLGAKAEFIGAVRPAAPYAYTNEWGAAMGVLVPLAIYSTHLLRTARMRKIMWGVLAFSTVPIVISVNRGLWASVIVALTVVALRAGLARRFAVLSTVGAAVTVVALLIVLTPLHDVIANRLARPNLSTRESLIGGALALTRESPLFGHGAPVEVSTLSDTNAVAVGTHGQLWTLLVAQGLPGALFYVGFFAVVLVATWQIQGWALWAWSAIVVSLVQMPFYNALPVPLVLAMIAVAICWRELASSVQHFERSSSPVPLRKPAVRVGHNPATHEGSLL